MPFRRLDVKDCPADLAKLSRVNKTWHAVCVPYLWEVRLLSSIFLHSIR